MKAYRLAFVFWAMASSASASFSGCTKQEREIIDDATSAAKGLAIFAAAAVGDTEIYERWFGSYSKTNAETVRRNLKSIATAIRSGEVSYQCDPLGTGACEVGTYAFVYDDTPYHVHLCQRFFRQPVMASLRPGSQFSDNGSRAGTIIHEVSHFRVVASTEDHCYTRRDCADFAIHSPQRAIENADSYQYFAEDIVHFADRAAQDAAARQ